MSKILVLTALVLAGGVDAIAKVIAENPAEAAQDILTLKTEMEAAVVIAEKSLEALDRQPVKAENTASFTHEHVSYGFNFKSMIHNGKRISVEDVQADEALQGELISIGSGMIYLID